MKVLVAGATGALGRVLVPKLAEAGHDVVGMTRSAGKVAAIRALGAGAVVANGLDASAVKAAVARVEPEVVVHQMTALAGGIDLRRFDDSFAVTNRLRIEGTDHLMAAARASGVRRVLVQSFAGWNLQRDGSPTKTEDVGLDPNPPAAQRNTLDAIRHLEAVVTTDDAVEGVVLRYAGLTGAGSGFAKGAELHELVRHRRLPVIGDGSGVWSFVDLEDAATATMLAVDHGAPGIYQIADDEPAEASVWLPEFARIIGAKPPRRVPVWLGRMAAGEVAVSLFTRIRGADNALAKRELGWTLRYPSWRDSFGRTG